MEHDTTDADIPNTLKRDFSEMEEYCKKCGSCVKNCKGGAILENPIEREGGLVTRIDRAKCMQSLLNNNYCSFCLKICARGIPK